MVDLSLELSGIKMKNPVMVASGTFGYAKEFADLVDLNKLGAIVTKSITLKPRAGNPPPRLAEVAAGLINSIGLQNDGVDYFIHNHLPYFKTLETPLIVNIAGETVEEYVELARRLDKEVAVKGLEINISCPNVSKGGMEFGVDPKLTAEVIGVVRKATTLPLIAKLTPNVTDIRPIAQSAVEAGANILSMINTVLSSAEVTVNGKRHMLKGGLSGPAIKPIALRMIRQVREVVKVPIIGMGGIMGIEDALEFFEAGAQAIAIGTANFVDPKTAERIIEELEIRGSAP